MYKSGDIINAKITNITHFGFFFITKDNWRGLVHISEISNSYIYNISDYFEKGQDIEVLIIDLDENKKQISGSYKHANIDNIKTKKFDKPEDFAKLKQSLNKKIEIAIKEMEK